MNADLLRQLLSAPTTGDRFFGVVAGVVTNNKDPENLHRVKVQFPWLDESHDSHWARVATPMAGPKRGLYFLPEVGDEVLVAFEHGAVDFPYVLGALWNGRDECPETNADGTNAPRAMHSRSGHIFRFLDRDGDERIEIIDKSGNQIVINANENTITIESQLDIVVTSRAGKLKLSGVGIELTSQTDVKINASTTMDVQAGAVMTLKGALIKLN